MSSLSPAARHRLVVGGVVASLLVGALAVRAASVWTAAAAPLGMAPVSASSVESALAAERARSDALVEELDLLTAQSRELEGMLGAAVARVRDDTVTAQALEARLATAEKKLKRLQASIRAAQARSTSVTSVAAAPSSGDGREGEEHERDDDD